MKKLFLDDYRSAIDCVSYMHSRIGKENPIYLEGDWIVVKNYPEFVKYISDNGIPDLISFDHDLAEEHYTADINQADWQDYYLWEGREETGYDCLVWLIDYCIKNAKSLPKCYFHSMNPVGTENMISLYTNTLKNQK